MIIYFQGWPSHGSPFVLMLRQPCPSAAVAATGICQLSTAGWVGLSLFPLILLLLSCHVYFHDKSPRKDFQCLFDRLKLCDLAWSRYEPHSFNPQSTDKESLQTSWWLVFLAEGKTLKDLNWHSWLSALDLKEGYVYYMFSFAKSLCKWSEV